MSSCEHSLNTLRYADRVKELAANDPTETKNSPSDDDQQNEHKLEEDHTNNSVLSDSDLAQLRSLNVRKIIKLLILNYINKFKLLIFLLRYKKIFKFV